MSDPTVSVMMNCLDEEEYVREAIESVVDQTYRDWEIVFWDNGSTDRSGEIAREYEPRLRYFRSEETVPLYEARNRALERCRGRYVAFLDCDDYWLPEKLELQMELFAENPDLGLVYSDSILTDGRHEWRNFERGTPERGYVFGELLARYWLHIHTVVIPRDVFDGLEEAFDPRFQIAGDQDLFLRVAHEHPVDYVERPLAVWRMHGENWSLQREELLPLEQEAILTKLRERFPEIETEYADALDEFERQLDRKRALSALVDGDRRQAREVLGGQVLGDALSLGLFGLSFLPGQLPEQGVRLVRRLRRG